jgi:glucose uptake protein GlcU
MIIVSRRNWHDNLTVLQKRALGGILSLIAGFMYSVMFNPVEYLRHNGQGNSSNELDYVFSLYVGIFASSTVIFLIYCGYKHNRPYCPSELVLPSFMSGIIFAIATIGQFIANGELGFVIVFPLSSAGPGVVAVIAGILLFKEIQVACSKNFLILLAAIITMIIGSLFIALSIVL